MVLGYSKSIELIIMANGGTFEQQATLSLIAYALLVKFIFAPLIDTYYLAYIGRSKTYIFILGVLAGVSVLLFSSRADDSIQKEEISLLTSFWLFVNLLANFQQVAFESWTVTIVERPYRKYMGIMLVTGFSTGYFISFNVFVCLNSIQCLQKYLSWLCSLKQNKSQRCNGAPLVNHTSFVRFMGVQVLVLSFYILLFVKERIVEQNQIDLNKFVEEHKVEQLDHFDHLDDQNSRTKSKMKAIDRAIESPLKQQEGSNETEEDKPEQFEHYTGSESNAEVGQYRSRDIYESDDQHPDRGLRGILCQFIPKLVKNDGMRVFVFYLIASRFFFELYKRSLELRLVQKGLPKDTIIFVNTIVYPLILLAGYLSSYFIRKGVAMRRYHFAVLFDILICLHRFYLTSKVVQGEHISTTFLFQLVVNYVLELAEHWTFYFWFGHLNLVASDLAYSSTIMGVFTSVNNAADWGVNTLGLKTIAFFEKNYNNDGYNGCVIWFTFCALVSMCVLWKNTYYLDEMPVDE